MIGDAALNREIHRYFPEWADLPTGRDPLREADRNSYLAGGYADEFGYGTEPHHPAAILPLDGDPESSGLWREQIGALHPGYPQCPKPLDRMTGPDDRPMRLESQRDRSATPRSGARPQAAAIGFRVVPVRPRAQAALGRVLFRVGPLAFMAERLMRRRHLNDVL